MAARIGSNRSSTRLNFGVGPNEPATPTRDRTNRPRPGKPRPRAPSSGSACSCSTWSGIPSIGTETPHGPTSSSWRLPSALIITVDLAIQAARPRRIWTNPDPCPPGRRRCTLIGSTDNLIGNQSKGYGQGAVLVSGREPLSGVLPVFQTPCHDDETIDEAALEGEIHRLFGRGADGIVMAMVSEVPRLDADERCRLAEHARRFGDDRGAVVVGVGSESALSAERFARHAGAVGATATMAIPPVSIGVGEDELILHCRKPGIIICDNSQNDFAASTPIAPRPQRRAEPPLDHRIDRLSWLSQAMLRPGGPLLHPPMPLSARRLRRSTPLRRRVRSTNAQPRRTWS